jgi:hypothetical protein
MDNYNSGTPRKRVTRKVARQRQLTALAVIALIVLLIVVLIAKGCSNTDTKKKSGKSDTQATTEATEPSTEDPLAAFPTEPEVVPESTEPTIDQALTAQVELSKRELFLQVGESDLSYINAYPDGSSEENEVWESSDASIAAVDKYGHVTGVSAGECYVILTFDNNPGVRIQIKVYVAGSASQANAQT